MFLPTFWVHSQGFSICFIIKNLLNSLHIAFNFHNRLYFQSEPQSRHHAIYSLYSLYSYIQARYNKPIRILGRMVQIIWLVEQNKSCQKFQTIKVYKPSKFTICSCLHTGIVRQVEFDTFARRFCLKYRILKWNVQRNPAKLKLIKTHEFSTWRLEHKLLKACVLWMNDNRIHRNIKIARYEIAVKLGCCDWCGLPLNASERISGKTLSCSLEGRSMWFLRLASLQWPDIAMMS